MCKTLRTDFEQIFISFKNQGMINIRTYKETQNRGVYENIVNKGEAQVEINTCVYKP